MKRLVRFGIVPIALTMSGWSGASTLNVSELCGGIALFDHPETRVYRGKFEDDKGVTLDHVLVVTQTTDAGKALVFHIHGKQLQTIERPNAVLEHPLVLHRLQFVAGLTV